MEIPATCSQITRGRRFGAWGIGRVLNSKDNSGHISRVWPGDGGGFANAGGDHSTDDRSGEIIKVPYEGNAKEVIIAITATTTISSMRVKPFLMENPFFPFCGPLLSVTDVVISVPRRI